MTDTGPARRRILIVEDEYFVALTMEDALTDAGYEVIGVEVSGEEAVVRVQAERPDLILMDIRLAGTMDGIDAALQLRPIGSRVLFSSAHSDGATRARGQEAQPVGWLTKPFTTTSLLAAVARALQEPMAN
ncbi:response regulator [Polymorphobacter sp.]|uniref:response regulator n=1 Tax=Polymorphobacter sp. TaxID=1909290 RepID=UPI003F71FE17